jgi:hypothetical protein
MTRDQILKSLQDAVKLGAGRVPGERAFLSATGLTRNDLYNAGFARYGEVVSTLGMNPNQMKSAIADEELLAALATLAQRLGKIPTIADIRVARAADQQFPGASAFDRLVRQRGSLRVLLLEYCRRTDSFVDLAEALDPRSTPNQLATGEQPANDVAHGYVYLFRHGTRREFKIGKTRNPLRREGEVRIELPHEIEPIHRIETDDPDGVESYWHRRFEAKRLRGEWFALSQEDVRAFRRWKKIF